MDKLDLTSSKVLKGTMKFKPKIGGKKDKLKKSKKVTKGVNLDGQKKLAKKNVTKKPLNEIPQNSNIITIDVDSKKIESKNIEQENGSKQNEIVNKSITVNTISNKNNIESPNVGNKNSDESLIKANSPQNNVSNSINESQVVTSKSKNVENETKSNAIIENKKDVLAKLKTADIKSNIETDKGIIETEDDTISEISDDFLKSSTMDLNDSIVDSATEIEMPKRTNERDNEKTLIEEAENSDNSNKELSSELADETLIIEDSQRILETDEEIINKISKKDNETANQSKDNDNDDNVEKIIDEIKNKKNNKTKNQNIKKVFTDLINKNNESEEQDKIIENENESNKSIYELLEQEEFNQSIDTEVYNKPINHEDEEIQHIVKEKIAPKRKVGRPPKKSRGRKPAKKQIEVIVISDSESSDDDDDTISLAQKKTLIKKELEKDLPAKVKQEDEESQQIPVNSLKRSNFAIEIEEQERPIRQIKRARATKKSNNNNSNNNNNSKNTNENEIVEQENTSHDVLEENVNNNEKGKKANNARTTKSKTAKSQKATKASKTSKTTKTNKTTAETEAETETEQSESGETGQKKKVSKKRKASSPSKRTTKKKKVNGEEGKHKSSDGEDSDNISISSRTIADIIDNYRGTEISTTQKEIYRLAALKRKATLDRKRGRLTTPEITTQTVPEKPKEEKMTKKPKVYDPEKNKTAIQMRVVNGEIVIDQQSTMIDHIDTTDEALPMLKYDENNHITSASFKPKLKPLKWSKEETELFYKCLSIFGTNFSMLAIMFPSRNRKQLLNKYKNEEKINPGHVKYALKHKMALDPEFFEKYSGQNMMEIGREAVEEVRLIEEQKKKEDMELFNIKMKENDTNVKRVIIKNENLYDNNDVKDVKPILAN